MNSSGVLDTFPYIRSSFLKDNSGAEAVAPSKSDQSRFKIHHLQFHTRLSNISSLFSRMYIPLAILASFFPLLLAARILTLSVKCSGPVSQCALEHLNSTASESSTTIEIITSKLSIIPVPSSTFQTSSSTITFSAISSSQSSSTPQNPKPPISLSTSLSTQAPSTSRTPSTTQSPLPPPAPSSSSQTASCVCLTTGPFCAHQSTPRPPTFHGPQTKSLSSPPVSGTACPTSKDVLLRCGKVGQPPKVEKCKFMGFGWKVHCAESRVGVDSCGGVRSRKGS